MGTADSTNIRSPQITGDDEPRPGISTFQRMFFVSLHSVGGVADLETPVAKGPRHCGQKRWPAVAPSVLRRAWPAVALPALWRASGPAHSADMTASSAAGMISTRAALTWILLGMSVV
jgi:hypothetical protein